MIDAAPKPGDGRLRLPVGTLLDEVYLIDGEIGAGGFGITYRGRDTKLGLQVAIKEYFPADIGNRDSTMSVHPVTMSQGEVFAWGRDGFIREAQMLAGFKHPGIVRVLRYFEANNTAYMVLEYEEGMPFGKWLASLGRRPSEAEIGSITRGIMDALEIIHERRLVHRDIAPDNIIIRPDMSPVLLDFGAARFEVEAASRASGHSLLTRFPIVKPHYSPIEQRSTDLRNRGPWSDVYSLGATLYKAVTGNTPPDTTERLTGDEDPLTPAMKSAAGRYSEHLLSAIDAALSVKRQDRPQSIAALREMAWPSSEPQAAVPATGLPEQPLPGEVKPAPEPDHRGPDGRHDDGAGREHGDGRKMKPMAAAVAGVAVLLLVAMWAQLSGRETNGDARGRSGSAGIATTPPAPADPPGSDNASREARERSLREAEARAREAKLRRQLADAEAETRRAREAADRVAQSSRDERERLQNQTAARLLEAERKLADAQAARAARPEPPPAPPAAPGGPTLWSHNNSVMRLVANGRQRQFFYFKPRAGLVARGVLAGTLLFDGERVGDTYTGRSRVFTAKCGPRTYVVSGTVSPDQRRVVMHGQKPIVNLVCETERTEADELVFELLESKSDAPVAATTFASNTSHSSMERRKGLSFAGQGYREATSAFYDGCASACLADSACRAAEFRRDGKCRLHAQVTQTAASTDTDIGIKKTIHLAAGTKVLGWVGGPYDVQIGSFQSAESALGRLREVAASAQDLVGDARIALRPLEQSGGIVLHRARFIGFDEASARRICESLSARGVSCFVANTW